MTASSRAASPLRDGGALKGSGRTPYSRAGDGRAVLQNALREMVGDASLVALDQPLRRSGPLAQRLELRRQQAGRTVMPQPVLHQPRRGLLLELHLRAA